MDNYFQNQQKQIELLNEKLDMIIEKLSKEVHDQEELVQANYLEKKTKRSRATCLKYRTEWISKGWLRPVQMPSGRVMYRKSEIDQLLSNGRI